MLYKLYIVLSLWPFIRAGPFVYHFELFYITRNDERIIHICGNPQVLAGGIVNF